MSETKDTYLTDLFINEAKPALKRHSGSGGGETSGATIKPLTITENGVYKGGTESGKQVGYSPVTVDVPVPKVKPFTFTENGVYDVANEDIRGANPVTVALPKPYKQAIIDGGGINADELFRKWPGFYPYGLEYADFETVETANSCFEYSYIKTLPLIDTKKLGSAIAIFRAATGLEIVPALDFRSVFRCNTIFELDAALKEVWLLNIKASLQVGSGATYGHLLTVESLIHLIYQLRDTGSLKTFTIGSINIDKLANVYVRQIEITDEMRAEDDLIDEKLPFEVCESTDEGACLITEYVSYKNWEIA